MSSKKIILKNLKGHGTIWHPDTCLVFKSKDEKFVIGSYDKDTNEITDLTDAAIELCDQWKFKIDESLFEEIESETEETTEKQNDESETNETTEQQNDESEDVICEATMRRRREKGNRDEMVNIAGDVVVDIMNKQDDLSVANQIITIINKLHETIEDLKTEISASKKQNENLTKETHALRTKWDELKKCFL